MTSTMKLHGHLKIMGLLVLTGFIIPGSSAQNTNFSFRSFSSPDNFEMVQDVQYNANNFSFLMNSIGYSLETTSCGRLLYKDKVKMKDRSSGAVASFHTAFTFSISGLDYWGDETGILHGDGLAFTFARNISLLGQSPGSSLCLLQESDNGLESNRVFAVEFDTFRNYWFNDSSNNHIGVNRNSMNSTWSHNLCGGTIPNCTYLANGGSFTAWIDYDSPSHKLEVYFANGSLYNSIPKPAKPVIEAPNLRLDDILDDYMYVGFSASTGLLSEVHTIQSWQFTSSGMPEIVALPPVQPPMTTNPGIRHSSTSRRKVGIITGVCAGVGAVLLLAGIVIAKRRMYTKQGTKFNLVDQNLVPRMFTYKELSKATKNFSRSELLGSGGFGAVYKGILPSGVLVAVKRMRNESKHGEEGFQAEAASLSQIRHRNLVQLRGWCHEEEQLLLVYDFMCNGSLDEWLFQFAKKKKTGPLRLNAAVALPLQLRHSILSGVAAALSYLHEECKQCVLHRDIKSSNVLLDEDLNAYLGDFGLARLIDHRKIEKTTLMAGTLGYMAPEMPHTGKATKESDVYSFGVLMLEVMCGTRSLDSNSIERGDGTLVDRAWRAHEAGDLLLVSDSRLGTFPTWSAHSGNVEAQEAAIIHEFDSSTIHTRDPSMEDRTMVANLLHLGLLCCNPNPEDRPSMRLVSQLLQPNESTTSPLPPLPRCKPQARYSRPGFSHMAMVRSLSSTQSVENVREGEQPSSQSSVSDGERTNMQTSFATTSSSVLSGR